MLVMCEPFVCYYCTREVISEYIDKFAYNSVSDRARVFSEVLKKFSCVQ